MKAPEVVQRYAGTLLDAAAETGVDEQVRGDVEALLVTLSVSAELSNCLADPLAGAEGKGRVVEQLFRGKVQDLTLNFLMLLARRRRIGLLPNILQTCVELFDERSGIVEAEVRASAPLSEEQQDRLRDRLSAYVGKRVRLKSSVDASIRGGVVAQIGDTVFDGSLTTQLRRLHQQLIG